jgi:hypothetical protein
MQDYFDDRNKLSILRKRMGLLNYREFAAAGLCAGCGLLCLPPAVRQRAGKFLDYF